MNWSFLKIFLIYTFQDPTLAEKWNNLAKNNKRKRKLNSDELMEFAFSKSDVGAIQYQTVLLKVKNWKVL